MLFDLTDLRLFILIAELKSLTRSAERMHLSLAATSNRIKELESRFGMRLLYRENKGVQLSPAGQTCWRMRSSSCSRSSASRATCSSTTTASRVISASSPTPRR
jgi:DNA-binding transcriptional LysR family regulator